MKLLSILCTLLLVISISTGNTYAQAINVDSDSALISQTGIFKEIKKVIVAKVQKQQVISTTNKKYSQEFLYFFHKLGFKRSPVSYLLFEDGSNYALNAEWQSQQFDNNLNTGVLFVLLVYSKEFNPATFEKAIQNFKDTVLKTKISETGIRTLEDIEVRQFIIETQNNAPIVTFQNQEDSAFIRNKVSDLNFTDKKLASLQLENIAFPQNVTVNDRVKAQITLKNTSNIDALFNENFFVQAQFDANSKFFVNNTWLNQRTPLRLDTGFIKANESKVLEIDLAIPLLPGVLKEKITLKLGDTLLGSKEISVNIQNNGVKILRVKPTSSGYVNIRKEARANSADMGRATSGSTYAYTEIQNNFYKIEYLGQQGWIASNSVEIITK